MTNDKTINNKSIMHDINLPRLNKIKGQIEGIKKMIEESRYCPEILTQLKAVRIAIRNVEVNILESHLSHCVTKAFDSNDEYEKQKKIEEIKKLIKKFE
ncbi:MAG: hypothetical protein BGO27_03490 [Alphaproteobacteria bacterium 33-17]|jgi:DNA-binding FrmR family transcriptional regulator|nr:MAG: hypothetical protein BGO27_03490 [Alphaproteobacteria bacterium 33-17]